jgi:hypothetical protein
MRILVTNDDGDSFGLRVLLEAAKQLGLVRRSVTMWRNDPKVLAAIPETALAPLGQKLAALANAAADRAMAMVRSGEGRLGEVANVLRVSNDGARIAAGEVTRRSESRQLTISIRAEAEKLAAELNVPADEVMAELEALMSGEPVKPPPPVDHDRVMAELLGADDGR